MRRNSPYDNLRRPDAIFRPYAYDRVEVHGTTFDGRPIAFSLLGVLWGEYRSGPSLFRLAAAAAEVTNLGGFYGLASSRPRGFQKLEGAL